MTMGMELEGCRQSAGGGRGSGRNRIHSCKKSTTDIYLKFNFEIIVRHLHLKEGVNASSTTHFFRVIPVIIFPLSV